VRYIDFGALLERPGVPELIERTNQARVEIAGARSKRARKALIRKYRPLWVEFRAHFEAVYGAKCWYIECSNPGTDDDVDHFRPKARVDERRDHPGYWWEALNWRNFRLSCHRANRPRRASDGQATFGKANHFPVIDEKDRWLRPSELCRERPALLDPTDPADPPLLTFDQHGFVALSPAFETDATAVERFEASRNYLWLDWPDFVRARRDLYAAVWLLVEQGDALHHLLSRGESVAKEGMKAVSRSLIALTRDKQEYSRAAAAYVRMFRDREWIRDNVMPHIPGPHPTELEA
jgi:hypothetical protein